jgi:hypothetical protein
MTIIAELPRILERHRHRLWWRLRNRQPTRLQHVLDRWDQAGE